MQMTVSTSPLRDVPGVYVIHNDANGKVYVGSTHNLARRLYEHERQLCRNTHRNAHLQAAWNEHGPGAFRFTPVAIVRDRTELLDIERDMIARLQAADHGCGYNISVEPSNNQLGLRRSAETRARIGRSKLGNKNRLGKGFSDDARRRIAEKLRGRKASPETRAKLSACRAGKPKSQEWVDKIQLSRARTMGYKYTPRTTV